MTTLPAKNGPVQPPKSGDLPAVRAVNGWGARCGCGGESVLHLRVRPSYGPVTPERSRFLCAACVEAAVDAHMAETGQPSYWPGDEDRDQPYERPVG